MIEKGNRNGKHKIGWQKWDNICRYFNHGKGLSPLLKGQNPWNWHGLAPGCCLPASADLPLWGDVMRTWGVCRWWYAGFPGLPLGGMFRLLGWPVSMWWSHVDGVCGFPGVDFSPFPAPSSLEQSGLPRSSSVMLAFQPLCGASPH